jgi:hypothetical protein
LGEFLIDIIFADCGFYDVVLNDSDIIGMGIRKEGCMMNTIVNEKLIPFKELEQKIFNYICELDRDITQIILERYTSITMRMKGRRMRWSIWNPCRANP